MKKLTEQHKRRIGEAHKRGAFFSCIQCGSQFWRSPSRIKKGENKFCSLDCYFLWQIGKKKIVINSCAKTGENNPNWRGGITPPNFKIRNSKEYQEWRQKVFERDGWTCQCCQAKSRKGLYVRIEAHHIKPFATHKHLRFIVSNGLTLCKKCHDKEPKGSQVWYGQKISLTA